MNKYEGMFLLDHGKVKNDVDAGIAHVRELLEKHGASIVELAKWDERKLAYEINNQKRGIYVLCYFESEGDQLDAFRHDVALSETIVRMLITRLKKKFPDFMTARELDDAFGTRDFRDRGPRRSGPPPRSSEGGGGGGGQAAAAPAPAAAPAGDESAPKSDG